VVRWLDQYRDHHELADHIAPDREAYLTVYHYPAATYCPHFARAGNSPRGYAGPAGCRHLLFDIDRTDDLEAAVFDTRTLLRYLLARYPAAEDGIGVYFSGAKGFHLTVEVATAAEPTASVPAACKRLALMLAAEAGVTTDTSIYDIQRIVRLPNSTHPRTGLYKRFLTHDELFRLNVAGIMDVARHPAGFPVPGCTGVVPQLDADWREAATAAPVRVTSPSVTNYPAVPKYVRDFIGWGDIQDPGRAVTLFRAAASLAEAGTPNAVVFGLLEEPALKIGLDPAEVRKQISGGIAHAGRKGGGG
jgi:hypothetical protein